MSGTEIRYAATSQPLPVRVRKPEPGTPRYPPTRLLRDVHYLPTRLPRDVRYLSTCPIQRAWSCRCGFAIDQMRLKLRRDKSHTGFLFASNIAAGAYHSIIVSDRGDVYAFGSNRNGQLGNGQADLLPHPTPVRMDGLPLLRGLRVAA
eukprot:595728-Rhodomonas_salina.1